MCFEGNEVTTNMVLIRKGQIYAVYAHSVYSIRLHYPSFVRVLVKFFEKLERKKCEVNKIMTILWTPGYDIL